MKLTFLLVVVAFAFVFNYSSVEAKSKTSYGMSVVQSGPTVHDVTITVNLRRNQTYRIVGFGIDQVNSTQCLDMFFESTVNNNGDDVIVTTLHCISASIWYFSLYETTDGHATKLISRVTYP